MSDFAAIYTSRDADTNAILADKDFTTYKNIRIRKSGDSEDETSNETGVNAAVLSKNKSILRIEDSYITSGANYGDAVFSLGNDTSIESSKNTIVTDAKNASGIVAINGYVTSNNDSVTTYGENSPAVRTDSLQKTKITGGTFITNGINSPAIDANSDIDILYAENIVTQYSPVIKIRSKAEVNIQSSNINVNNFVESEKEGINSCLAELSEEIYNEDADEVSLIINQSNVDVAENVPIFKVSNIKASINLTKTKINSTVNTDLINVYRPKFDEPEYRPDDEDFDLEEYDRIVKENDAKYKGGELVLIANNQALRGNVNVDPYSSLRLIVKNSSTFVGKINSDGASGKVDVVLASGSWTLTGDSYVDSLDKDDLSVIMTNGYNLYVAGVAYDENPSDNPVEKPTEFTTTYATSRDRENAYTIKEDSAVLTTVKIVKKGDSNEKDAYYNGINAAVLPIDSNLSIINHSLIETNGQHAAAVVSYTDSEVTVSDTTISTKDIGSPDLVTSYGGNLTVLDATATTEGEDSPAVVVGHEGGYISVYHSTLQTTGTNSPIVKIDPDNKGSINLDKVSGVAGSSNGIDINGSQKDININNSNISANLNYALYIHKDEDSEDKEDIVVNADKSTFNGLIGVVIENTHSRLNFEGTKISKGITLINSNLDIDMNQGSINGDIVLDKDSKITIDLHKSADLIGSVNKDNIKTKKTEVILRNAQWTLTDDSYIDVLDVDKYSDIYLNGHTLYVNGVESKIEVGSVVNYSNADETVQEEDVVVISISSVGDNTYYTLYDTDDKVTYNNVPFSHITFTGRTVDIEPILQDIDELVRNDHDENVVNGDTIVISVSDKNAVSVTKDNSPKEYEDLTIKKSGDSIKNTQIDNSAVVAKDGGDLTLHESSISTASTYANGIVSIGEGSIITIDNVKVETTGNNSIGVLVSDKGKIVGKGLTSNTSGFASPAIKVENGGDVELEDSTFSAIGASSNSVKVSDANIFLTNATIKHDRSIAPMDITGQCIIKLLGGYLSDSSMDVVTGGIHIHNTDITPPEPEIIHDDLELGEEEPSMKSYSNHISVVDGVATIETSGTYTVSGKDTGSIHVLDDDTTLVFKNVDLISDDKDPITVEGKNFTIELVGSNKITNNLKSEDEGKFSKAIFVKGSFNLTGNGSLNINSAGEGIYVYDIANIGSEYDKPILNINCEGRAIEAFEVNMNANGGKLVSVAHTVSADNENHDYVTAKLNIISGKWELESDNTCLNTTGDFVMSGGEVICACGERDSDSALNYKNFAYFTDGTILITSMKGNDKNITNGNHIVFEDVPINAGAVIEIKDAEDNVVYTSMAKKSANKIIFAMNGMNTKYTLYLDSVRVAEAETKDFTPEPLNTHVYGSLVTYSYDTKETNSAYTSTNQDENAIEVTNGNIILNNPLVSRVNDKSTGGNASTMYGTGAAVIVKGGSLTMVDGNVTTDAKGSVGVFATGGDVDAENLYISTKQDDSSAISASGNGKLVSISVTGNTKGENSPAIRARNSGSITINKGSYTSENIDSPAIYSEGTVVLNDVTVITKKSEAAYIEGDNSSIEINGGKTTYIIPDNSDKFDFNAAVEVFRRNPIYRYELLTDKDGNKLEKYIDTSKAVFTAKNTILNTVETAEGGIFYTTNTVSEFNIENTEIVYPDNISFLLRAMSNSKYGTEKDNGVTTSFNATNQKLEGDIYWDTLSKLSINLLDGSTYTGRIIDDETYAKDIGKEGFADVYLDESSKWIVTGDSTISKLTNLTKADLVDSDNKTVKILDRTSGETIVEGDSDYTISVTQYVI